MNKGQLYIVSIPIGNRNDITKRALDVLKSADVIITEEASAVNSLFAVHKFKKEYFVFNEHNESKDADYVLDFILKGENCALISDCGTPVFADPGRILLKKCYENKINIIPVPGPSSLTALLSLSPIDIKKFYFAGFLGKTKNERVSELKSLRSLKVPVVLMDTPYRLADMLEDTAEVFKGRRALFLYKATMNEETVLFDSIDKISSFCKKEELKGEFMLLVEN